MKLHRQAGFWFRGVGMGFAFTIVCAAHQGAVAGSPALGVVEQFQDMQHHGDALAFRLGVADDSYDWTWCDPIFGCSYEGCKHYQGLARMDVEGIPYFFLTRSGAQQWACGDPDNPDDNPGEVVVVQLASRPTDGERLRSNRLWPGVDMEDTPPPEEDRAVVHLHFSERGEPGWVHPGGVQIVDGVLAITMQDWCGHGFAPDPGYPNGGVGSYRCKDSFLTDYGGLVLVDVTDPTEPEILHNFRYSDRPSYGAVAVTKEPDGHYLFALSDPGKDLAFWRSNGEDLRDPDLALEEVSSWDPHNLGDDPEAEGWWGWQSINFVSDVDGDLYLVAADNDDTREPIYVGEDWVRLFRVTRDGDWYSLSFAGGTRSKSERRLLTEKPQMGNVKAASGVYVSPTGQLIFYTAHHNRYEDFGVTYLPMGEFRNIDVHVALSDDGLPPLVPVPEQVDVDGDGHDETSCSGWVELYDDVLGWDDNDSPHGARMFDFRDRHEESWNNLGSYEDFNDTASAVRWNLPLGQGAWLYRDSDFEGDSITLTGQGNVEDIGQVHPGWNDQISSVRIGPVADPGGPYAGARNTPIPLDAANPCYDWDSRVSFAWDVDSPSCTISDRTARRPSIHCHDLGRYSVRLTVTDMTVTDPSVHSAEASVGLTVAVFPFGKRLLVKQKTSATQRLHLLAKDTDVVASQPCEVDGELVVEARDAGTTVRVPLDAGLWKPLNPRKPEKGCSYRDGQTKTTVRIEAGGRIQVAAKGFDLVPLAEDPRPVRIALQHGEIRHCLEFSGSAGAYKASRRLTARNAAPTAHCPESGGVE